MLVPEPSDLLAGVQLLGPTWMKEITDSIKLSSGLHMDAVIYSLSVSVSVSLFLSLFINIIDKCGGKEEISFYSVGLRPSVLLSCYFSAPRPHQQVLDV